MRWFQFEDGGLVINLSHVRYFDYKDNELIAVFGEHDDSANGMVAYDQVMISDFQNCEDAFSVALDIVAGKYDIDCRPSQVNVPRSVNVNIRERGPSLRK